MGIGRRPSTVRAAVGSSTTPSEQSPLQRQEQAIDPFKSSSFTNNKAGASSVMGLRRATSWRRNQSQGDSKPRTESRRRTYSSSIAEERGLLGSPQGAGLGVVGAGGGASRAEMLHRRGSGTITKSTNNIHNNNVDSSNSTTSVNDSPMEKEEMLMHYQDVREELEVSGHNLTSVLNNPRETFMDSLYEAAFEAEPPAPDLEIVRANAPQGLRDVTPQVRNAPSTGYSRHQQYITVV